MEDGMSSLDLISPVPGWLAEALPVGLVILDLDLIVRHWCGWLERHSGLLAADLVGRPLLDRFPDLRERGVEALLRRALAGDAIELGPPEHSYLLLLPGTYGVSGPMRQRAALHPLRERGRVIGAVCTIADITPHAAQAEETQRALASVEEALRRRDSFFSLAAHELRTPLTALLGRAQLLQKWLERERTAEERTARSAEIVVAQARRLDGMITSLLEVSRILSGRIKLTPTPIDVRSLATQVVEQTRAGTATHQLQLALDDAPLVVRADGPRIEHVLQQLLNNAVRYSPGGGEVRTCVRRCDEEAVLEVADRGIGVPAAEREAVFEGFYRGENAKKLGSGGLGVSLFVARTIVELHGGRVELESEEGQGSTFSVHLPLDAAGRQSPAA
jgi:signal transduction histidine kinase